MRYALIPRRNAATRATSTTAFLAFCRSECFPYKAVQAPPDFEYADLLPSLHSVIEFEAVDDARTRVSISGVGYRDGDGYDALLEFFRHGNAWSFERLARRFDEGPLDWRPAVPAASPHTANHEVNTEDNTNNNGE